MFGFITNSIKDRISLIKIQLLDSLSKQGGELSFWIIFSFIALTFYVFLNFLFVLLLAKWLEDVLYSVLIVAVFYLLLMVLLFYNRNKVKSTIQDKIIRSISPTFFNNEE